MIRMGKRDVLIDHYFEGRPVLTMTEEKAIYRRNDGTYFMVGNDRKRITIVRRGNQYYYRSDMPLKESKHEAV